MAGLGEAAIFDGREASAGSLDLEVRVVEAEGACGQHQSGLVDGMEWVMLFEGLDLCAPDDGRDLSVMADDVHHE